MAQEMTEIRWHGRGGQGAKTAAQLVAQVALEEGKFSQGFPEYGPERMGAPIRGFTRISEGAIRLHCPIEHPDVVVVLDDGILNEIDVTAGMKPGGTLIINTPKARETYDFGDFKLATADVTGLAEKAGLKRGIVNTGIIGAFAKALPIVPLSALLEAIKVEFEGSRGPENAEAARMTHAHTEAE